MTSSLAQTLTDDLRAALKAREELEVATLRMALSAVKVASVAGPAAHELSDEEVRAVLRREVKKRREAAEAFAGAGRTDSAERERAEAAVLSAYLPAPLSEEELAVLVAAAVAETGASGPRDMGKVVPLVLARSEGRADGGTVAALVRRALAEA